jgi:hypothetical protein
LAQLSKLGLHQEVMRQGKFNLGAKVKLKQLEMFHLAVSLPTSFTMAVMRLWGCFLTLANQQVGALARNQWAM